MFGWAKKIANEIRFEAAKAVKAGHKLDKWLEAHHLPKIGVAASFAVDLIPGGGSASKLVGSKLAKLALLDSAKAK